MSDKTVSAGSSPTSDLRANGFDAHTIFEWFHHGHGTDSAESAAGTWRKVARHSEDAATAIGDALAKLRSSWRGNAAEALIESLVRDVEAAGTRAAAAADVVDAQISAFRDTKNRVVYVPPEPPRMSLTAPVNPMAPSNFAAQAEKYRAAVQANHEALHRYNVVTTDNVDRLDRPESADYPQETPRGRRRKLFGMSGRGVFGRKGDRDAD